MLVYIVTYRSYKTSEFSIISETRLLQFMEDINNDDRMRDMLGSSKLKVAEWSTTKKSTTWNRDLGRLPLLQWIDVLSSDQEYLQLKKSAPAWV